MTITTTTIFNFTLQIKSIVFFSIVIIFLIFFNNNDNNNIYNINNNIKHV